MSRYHRLYLTACALMILLTGLFFGLVLPAVLDLALT